MLSLAWNDNNSGVCTVFGVCIAAFLIDINLKTETNIN